MGIFSSVFGTYSDREIKRLIGLVNEIEKLDETFSKLSEEELKAKTHELKQKLSDGKTLEDILPEAFATVREASNRVLGLKHFKVQLIGGIILHQGRISEMKTGEGKTLVATLPVYLNALSGKGVHVVTVNDYLAKRDSEWMGKIYKYLGLSVGLVINGLTPEQRKYAYACDVTYGTNNEYGFDYLRDNMVISKDEMVQRDLNYAIVDEIDSILVDEARTPLIISGIGDKSTDLYKRADVFAKGLKSKIIIESDDKKQEEEVTAYDYIVDIKGNSATLTNSGVKKAEKYFKVESLSDLDNMTLSHHINQAIRANGVMKRDKDYVVKDGEVVIVDEFTGRLMFGRRYSDGLHQAIEAKEAVRVEHESKTLASITFQNYFRLYGKLAGMTGTAMTEEDEFRSIYKLDVVEIPTNKPNIRKDHNDVVYKSQKGKFNAVIKEIKESNVKGQPILVGTITIENSELLSKMLTREGIKHQVLNAKYHEKEAHIIAQAGKLGAVTIATNMAGRGTDIMLGGNPEYLAKQELEKRGYDEDVISEVTSFADTNSSEVLDAREEYKDLYKKFKQETDAERCKIVESGGFKIIGTERHESRRIDNQLRGRAGRQGDPGETRFYLSLEDDLMKMFGGERVLNLVSMLGMDDETPIEQRMLTSTIETAQKRVEGRNFSIRKQVLQFDDVMNKQREIIYNERKQVLQGVDLKENVIKIISAICGTLVNTYMNESYNNWDIESLNLRYSQLFGIESIISEDDLNKFSKYELSEKMLNIAMMKYEDKENEFTSEKLRIIERLLMLRIVDDKWMEHIDAMDEFRKGIYLRGVGQKDPVVEYRVEGFEMFDTMVNSIQETFIATIMHISPEVEIKQEERAPQVIAYGSGEENQKVASQTPTVKGERVGRNDLCPCGSGIKFKKCCGK